MVNSFSRRARKFGILAAKLPTKHISTDLQKYEEIIAATLSQEDKDKRLAKLYKNADVYVDVDIYMKELLLMIEALRKKGVVF